MEKHKRDRLYRERVNLLFKRLTIAWEARRSLLRGFDPNIIPGKYHFAHLPEVRAIIDVPEDVNITSASFEILQTYIAGIIDRWLLGAKKSLGAIMKDKLRLTDTSDVMACDLAASYALFCRHCNTRLPWPFVVTHCCEAVRCQVVEDDDDLYRVAVRMYGSPGTDNYNHIILKKRKVESIIRACGQDPSHVTAEEMDRLDIRLTCKQCNPVGTIEIMTWKAAVSISLFLLATD